MPILKQIVGLREPASAQTCRLLNLPPELLDLILTKALAVRSVRDAQAVTYQDLLDAPKPDRLEFGRLREPALALTCRQLRTESIPIFFAENWFVITHPVTSFDWRTVAWLKNVERSLWCIRSLEVSFATYGQRKPGVAGVLSLTGHRMVISSSVDSRDDLDSRDKKIQVRSARNYIDSVSRRGERAEGDKADGMLLRHIVKVAVLLVGRSGMTCDEILNPQRGRKTAEKALHGGQRKSKFSALLDWS